jgi:hypothetical protein
MARVASPNDAVTVSMIRVRFHLRVHVAIIVNWLLLWRRLLHLRGMIVGVECSVVARDDADLLIVFVGATRAVLASVFQSVE